VVIVVLYGEGDEGRNKGNGEENSTGPCGFQRLEDV